MKKIAVLVLLIMSIFASFSTTYAASTEIVGPDVITKQASSILTITDILSLYRSDVGSIILSEDLYTGYGNVLGMHSISLYASNGEIAATKEILINVITTLGNVQCVTDYKDIHVRTDQILTPSDIVYVLQNSGYIEITASTQMMLLANTYTENAEIEGQYLFEFRLVNSAGIDAVYSSVISVSDNNNLFIPDLVIVPEPSQFDQVIDFIVSIFYLAIFVLVGFIIFKTVKKNRKKGFQ